MNRARKYILVFIVIIFISSFFAGCGENKAIQRAEISDTDMDRLENYKLYLQEYPNGKHVDEAKKALLNTALRLAFIGYAFNDNPQYNSKEVESNKIYIIDDTTYLAAMNNRVDTRDRDWTALLPDEWKAETIFDASLFCIVKETSIKVGSEKYSAPGSNAGEYTVQGYRVVTQVELRQATTGEILFSAKYEGSDPSFPDSIKSGTGAVEGSSLNYYDLEAWLMEKLY